MLFICPPSLLFTSSFELDDILEALVEYVLDDFGEDVCDCPSDFIVDSVLHVLLWV